MGTVYQATDTKLGREVAIKVLPASFAEDTDRIARFAREAKVLASLNHPNIAQIYGIEERALVMELVPGETLKPPLPLETALQYAKQIAEALEAAHERGIVHRDLKPGNIKVTPDGTVKVLDFGLAKTVEMPSGDPQSSPTLTMAATQAGMIMGTAAYMSPEQAAGKLVDKRADVWSFGVVLWELLTGHRLFEGETISHTLAEVLRGPIDFDKLPRETPPAIRILLRRCLERNVKNRLRDIGEARIAIEATLAGETPFPEGAPAPGGARRPWLAWSAFLLAAAGMVGGAAIALLLTPPSGNDLSSYKLTSLARDEASQLDPAWSPGGKSIAYDAQVHGVYQIFVRAAGAASAAQLTRASRDCAQPFWSPDGLTVYYLSGANLWAVGVSGGVPQPMFRGSGAAAIHPDGKTFAIARDGKLYIGSSDEAKQREYRHEPFPSDASFFAVRFSSDGTKLAVALAGSASGQQGDVWILPWRSDGPPLRTQGILQRSFGISWFPDSRRLLLGRGDAGTYSLVALDTATGRKHVLLSSPSYLDPASVAPDGKRIAFTAWHYTSELAEVSLPDGRVSTLLSRSRLDTAPDWSPSGAHYLHSAESPAAIEDRPEKEGFAHVVVSLESEGIPKTAIALQSPRWAPDGMRFLFGVGFGGGASTRQLWVSNLSSGRPVPLLGGKSATGACWSPDGEWIAYLSSDGTGAHLFKSLVFAGANPVVLADAVFPPVGFALPARWSPAGDWILYPGKGGVSIVSPDGKSGRVLTKRGLTACGFSKHGDQVIGVFRDTSAEGAAWRLISIDVKTGAEKKLATLSLSGSVRSLYGFSLHPDGNRFSTMILRSFDDIYMLEGFDEPKSWLDRLLRR
jgi:Tol biopolymer transport system component